MYIPFIYTYIYVCIYITISIYSVAFYISFFPFFLKENCSNGSNYFKKCIIVKFIFFNDVYNGKKRIIPINQEQPTQDRSSTELRRPSTCVRPSSPSLKGGKGALQALKHGDLGQRKYFAVLQIIPCLFCSRRQNKQALFHRSCQVPVWQAWFVMCNNFGFENTIPSCSFLFLPQAT